MSPNTSPSRVGGGVPPVVVEPVPVEPVPVEPALVVPWVPAPVVPVEPVVASEPAAPVEPSGASDEEQAIEKSAETNRARAPRICITFDATLLPVSNQGHPRRRAGSRSPPTPASSGLPESTFRRVSATTPWRAPPARPRTLRARDRASL